MGYNPFHRRARGDADSSEFAATELSLPFALDSLPPGPDSLPSAADSRPSGIDSAVRDGVTDLGADSLPAPALEAAVQHRPTTSHIGRYALKGLLGQGGLGQVHEAWDPLLSRTVAVKTLQFNVDIRARVSLDALFLNEARAAAGLSHPHIVIVHDAGLSAHGVYIAMERLRGCDLRQRLADGWQPTPGQAALLVRRVADGLAYAHTRSVVHCDIKPANIFLGRRDRPKVLDFGIARVAHGSALPALDGAVLGSPHYLAPEQLQSGTVDARTDIHALGAVFYELLTLRKAFDGSSLEQITAAVLGPRPPPAHELRPGVSRTLSAIAAKAMALDPAERYASAGEMAAELRRWVDRHRSAETLEDGGAGATRPVSRPSWLEAGSGRRRNAILFGAMAVVAAVATLALALRVRNEPAVAGPAQAVVLDAPAAASPAPAQRLTDQPAAADESRDEAPASVAPADAAPAARLPDRAGAAVARAVPRTKPAAPAEPRDTRVPATVGSPVTGTLQFAISPWGRVEIDGVPAGITPPLARLNLPEGLHTVTVRNDDAPAFTTTVNLSADKPVTVRYRFGP